MVRGPSEVLKHPKEAAKERRKWSLLGLKVCGELSAFRESRKQGKKPQD